MKPCGFSVNTGSKQSELQTVEFVSVDLVVVVVGLNSDTANVAVSFVIFDTAFSTVTFSSTLIFTLNQNVIENSGTR